MKKGLSALILIVAALSVSAQDEEKSGGFEKQRLFTGGGISFGFGNQQTTLGASPVLGYTITEWLDAGLSFNYVYSSTRHYFSYGDKLRQTVAGPGVFTRLYPARVIFVQGQFERNFSNLKYRYPGGSPTEKSKVSSNSLLVGGGVALGRQPNSNTFFYISLLFDVIKDVNSPYVNVTTDPNNPANQKVEMRPLIRTGVNIGLFQGRNNRDM